MLKNLIGDDEIGRTIRKRQAIALNIGHVNLIDLSRQGVRIFRSTFHCDQSGLRVKSFDNFEIPSGSSPQIDHDLQVDEVFYKLLNHQGAVGLPVVSEQGEWMRSARAAE
jgi:hypothetical protein